MAIDTVESLCARTCVRHDTNAKYDSTVGAIVSAMNREAVGSGSDTVNLWVVLQTSF